MSYYRSGGPGTYYRPSFFGGLNFLPPVIKGLLISNVAAWFLVDFFLAPFTLLGRQIGGPGGLLTYFFALWPPGTNFWPWQVFTYMFLHGGFWHLFFNMLALWMFGMELENTWGSKKFFVYYLLCGLGAGIANILVAPLLGQVAPTVGASGAVFGVLIAFGMMFPDRPIYIYFLLPIRAKYFVAIYMGMELFYGVTGTSDGVAHFAHLGGAAVGFVYMLAEMGLIPARSWWYQLRGSVGSTFTRGGRVVHRDGMDDEVHDAKFYDIRSGRPFDNDEEVNQDVIDTILDKISKGGYQSLTEEEKRILNEASKKIH
jgi:membrane associated rhomboid family serine protease